MKASTPRSLVRLQDLLVRLLGNTVAGRGDRTIGTILGAGVCALAGRAIDRSDRPGYCRR